VGGCPCGEGVPPPHRDTLPHLTSLGAYGAWTPSMLKSWVRHCLQYYLKSTQSGRE